MDARPLKAGMLEGFALLAKTMISVFPAFTSDPKIAREYLLILDVGHFDDVGP
jgi:hypothetical protein